MRDIAGSTAAPAARCRNLRRRSFIASSLRFATVGFPQSLHLDVGRPDHLAPLLGLRRHIGAELRGGEDHRRGGRIGEPRLDDRVCEPVINLAVEPLDDLVWRTPPYADTLPRARFETRPALPYPPLLCDT